MACLIKTSAPIRLQSHFGICIQGKGSFFLIHVTGDLHGDIRRFDAPAVRRLKSGDSLIVCGDFGFIWNGDEAEQKVLQKLQKKKYQILFVDGPHENFDLLEQYPVEEWNGGKVHRIAENILHLMRGEVFRIEGRLIFAFGGGESQEKHFRIDAGKWWAHEMPSLAEMKNGVENLQKNNFAVDYIITHSPCPGVGGFQFKQNESTLDLYFEEIEKSVRHRKWFFGSTHINRHYTARCESVFDAVIPLQ